jgi:hypothetical protein
LRLLGVKQLGRLLLLKADQQQEAMQLETALVQALKVRAAAAAQQYQWQA